MEKLKYKGKDFQITQPPMTMKIDVKGYNGFFRRIKELLKFIFIGEAEFNLN